MVIYLRNILIRKLVISLTVRHQLMSSRVLVKCGSHYHIWDNLVGCAAIVCAYHMAHTRKNPHSEGDEDEEE